MTLTLYGTVTIYPDAQRWIVTDGRDWRVDEIDPLQPVTIRELRRKRSGWNSGHFYDDITWKYTEAVGDDTIMATTIYPGYDLRGSGNERLCHACYAARRQAKFPVMSKGPLNVMGYTCDECKRDIPSFRQAKPLWLAKSRPAHWER